MKFHSSEAGKVNSYFKQYFKTPFAPFFDGFWHLKPIILINIFKFEDWLEKNYNYNRNDSISEFVLTKFGKEAHDFLVRLI